MAFSVLKYLYDNFQKKKNEILQDKSKMMKCC